MKGYNFKYPPFRKVIFNGEKEIFLAVYFCHFLHCSCPCCSHPFCCCLCCRCFLSSSSFSLLSLCFCYCLCCRFLCSCLYCRCRYLHSLCCSFFIAFVFDVVILVTFFIVVVVVIVFVCFVAFLNNPVLYAVLLFRFLNGRVEEGILKLKIFKEILDINTCFFSYCI